MSATSVGQIGLDLVVNQKQFNRQMTGIQSLAKKAGKTLAAAFAVTKVVEFGKACIDLGSDLEEVQNVVNVTFPTMQAKVDAFAKDAASSFGLSETMAKKYTSTLGSMAKAFGFTEGQAYDMGSTLAGLAGDVASFYNLSQDEAYTKLKSVFTGETESLKELGVVMTQTALDSFAMANGFNKTVSAMSEAEKVALRYAFVQDKLSAAQGDFARTSDSWANQVKVMNLQFESLKATIGQGLIAAFTPVLKMLNQLIAKTQVLATAFKDMMEGMFGAQEVASAATATETMADSTAETAENLKKANKYVAGFDKVNKASSSSSSSLSGDVSAINIPSMVAEEKKAETSTGSLFSEFQKFETFLKKKFSASVQSVAKQFKTQFLKIKKTASSVFGDIKKLAEPFANYMKGPFCDYLATAFETTGETCADWLDSFRMVFEDAWDIVVYPILSKLIDQWLPGFTNFATQMVEIGTTIYSELKKIFDMLWENAFKPFMEFVTSMFMDFMDILDEFWNNWGDPILSSLQDAIFQTSNAIQVAWKEFFEPVFDALMEAADDIWTNHLGPLAENFMDMVGEFVDGALRIYNVFIVPLVEWISKLLAPVFEKMVESFSNTIKVILDIIDGLVMSLKGIIQFVTGIFTGDWEKAWTGIKNIFKGVFDGLVSIVKTPINMIIDTINGMVQGIVSGVNTVIKAINSISFKMPDWLGGQKVGFNLKMLSVPKIPKLWQGGYVKKNTPQLAMIGDNRHQGEVVAPEDKLREMAIQAVRAAGSGGITKDELEKIVNNAVLRIVSALYELGFNLDGEQVAKAERIIRQGMDRRFNTVEIG